MIYLVRTPKVVFERRTKSKRFLVSMTTSMMRLCVCVYITAQIKRKKIQVRRN